MGAWNYGVFDDDTAYDYLPDLKESNNIVALMAQYFDDVLSADYVEYDNGVAALVAAAVIDSAVNGTVYRCDEEELPEWIATLSATEFSPIISKAGAAITAVLSEKSELQELWFENKELYPSWLKEKEDIRERLTK
ncbi:MAG: DUF4259 domain-containing protein [Oscillospiraceae bacterium]|jgi:hypothetical protein|nr:DUF4259 domain-containing protein [Oscillospiraceae bacterium]